MRKNEVTIKRRNSLAISNSVEALIQFKEKHQGPLKVNIPLGEGAGGGGEEGIFFEEEKAQLIFSACIIGFQHKTAVKHFLCISRSTSEELLHLSKPGFKHRPDGPISDYKSVSVLPRTICQKSRNFEPVSRNSNRRLAGGSVASGKDKNHQKIKIRYL